MEQFKLRPGPVKSGHVKLVQVKPSQDWSSLVKTGKVNLDQIKLSQDMGSQVGGRSNQVIAGQVKLGLVISQTGSWTQKILDLKLKCFGPNTFLEQKSFWFKNVLENGV